MCARTRVSVDLNLLGVFCFVLFRMFVHVAFYDIRNRQFQSNVETMTIATTMPNLNEFKNSTYAQPVDSGCCFEMTLMRFVFLSSDSCYCLLLLLLLFCRNVFVTAFFLLVLLFVLCKLPSLNECMNEMHKLGLSLYFKRYFMCVCLQTPNCIQLLLLSVSVCCLF